MNTITVRQATSKDRDQIVQFQLAMAWETESMQLDRDTLEQGVNAVFDDPHKGVYYVAERDAEILGCLLTVPEWSDWRNGTVLWIHSVYVRPEHRQRGVFRHLHLHLQQLVEQSSEYQGLRLFVYRENEVAREVYRRLEMNDEHYLLFQWMKQK